jgi:hypothetical protein
MIPCNTYLHKGAPACMTCVACRTAMHELCKKSHNGWSIWNLAERQLQQERHEHALRDVRSASMANSRVQPQNGRLF